LSFEQALTELDELARRLRRDCPWDREQTARTIVPHTVEEAYEVADAALAEDDAKLVDELGDLLYQVVFLALLLEERQEADLEVVARSIHDKLVRRHPHVFGTEEITSARAVRSRWEEIKRGEEGREGIFHDMPESLPSLLYARKTQRRAAAVGFEYPEVAGALADLDDELAELKDAVSGEPAARGGDELGDLLFAAVNVARRLGADPELELRRATQRFRERIEIAERLAAERGERWSDLDLSEQERYFDEAKGHA
jgi:XTP/dITP diphosphohydrolase/tetrapyrrole methylase family protein/MazG family protein/ATP diphosphatase